MEDLKIKIENLLHENASDFEVSKLLKQDIKAYFGTLEKSFSQNNGKNFLVKHTKKIDTILKMTYKVAMRSMFGTYMPFKSTLPITLIALGSYGREQLCVYSDIDLMIVYKEVPGYNTKEMIEKILYILWDAGLKLGHRVHEVNELFEVSKTDITIKTSMIESRFIEGSKQLWGQTQNELQRIRQDNQEGFIRAKIEEMKILHKKYPMTMEPNLKEGEGGFRNANLVYWIGNILYNINNISELEGKVINKKDYEEFKDALYFLFKVRSALHLASGRKEDKLRLDLIPQVAKYLGYDDPKKHMKFSRKVISCLKIIKLYSIIWIDELSNHYSKKEMLIPKKKSSYYELLEQLALAPNEQFPVHPTFLKALRYCHREVTVKKDIYAIIYKIFEKTQSHLVLSTLIDTQLLGYTIPYLKKVINLPQFDGYHQFAVGIHTVKCIEALENIQDKRVKNLHDKLTSHEKVFIKAIVLIHDAGKGRRKNHSEVGTVLFKGFGKWLNCSEEEIKIGKNLILYHTLMSITAQREDLHSESVILKFSAHFQTQKELDYIYILTYADMNGVGTPIYNDFSARLINTLYKQASLGISNIRLLQETSKRVKKEKQLQRNTSFALLAKSLQKKTLNIQSDMFFIKNTPQHIVPIVKRAQELKEYDFLIRTKKFLTIEIWRKNNLDLSFLLQKLSHLEIVNMDIYQLFSGIKYFRIDFSQTTEVEDYPLLSELIIEALTKIHPLTIKKPKILKNDIFIDCDHSKENALMKLDCLDQKSLLAYIIQLFDSLKIEINSAKIHTKMNRINDLFLIQKNGNFCNNTNLIIKELTEN
ncbi:MAG: Possible nucleotidyltransferase [uncultured Sulfurovum sp.]|uniref:Bifunctional uridylyltransferase/uridylyl-removing enzyme n=1 Tax=uncultured Sulfurovum sp. TaxID=269237 RepID=A0A6S6UA79_9BACT|nr:MAG: Possible nucleotidyltransferase [uncultured Sulfurovum sp.]